MARAYRVVRKPSVLSTVGIAAAVALLVGFFGMPAGSSELKAATILKRLGEQIQAPQRIDVTMEHLALDQVLVDGHLQVSERGVAGDVQVTIKQRGDKASIEVDLALGLAAAKDGWVMIRKLVLPDPKMRAALAFMITPESKLLVKLPAGEVGNELAEGLAALKEFDVNEVSTVIQGMIDKADSIGAKVTQEADGTVRLTMPIEAAAAQDELKSLGRATGIVGERSGRRTARDDKSKSVIAKKLPNAVVEIVYEPARQAVRSIAVTGIGRPDGRVVVAFSEDDIDPARFDSGQVTDDKTRVIDLGAMSDLFENAGASEGGTKRR